MYPSRHTAKPSIYGYGTSTDLMLACQREGTPDTAIRWHHFRYTSTIVLTPIRQYTGCAEWWSMNQRAENSSVKPEWWYTDELKWFHFFYNNPELVNRRCVLCQTISRYMINGFWDIVIMKCPELRTAKEVISNRLPKWLLVKAMHRLNCGQVWDNLTHYETAIKPPHGNISLAARRGDQLVARVMANEGLKDGPHHHPVSVRASCQLPIPQRQPWRMVMSGCIFDHSGMRD